MKTTAKQAAQQADYNERKLGDGVNEMALAGYDSLEAANERPGLPAVWLGTAAARLGLIGQAPLADIIQVTAKGEWRGESLTSGEATKPNYAIVLSFPKTLSMLMASPDAALRAAVLAAHEDGIKAWVSATEAQITTRRGGGGPRTIGAGGVIAVHWLHQTSSAADPQVHGHIALAASCPGDDGLWRTLDGKVWFATRRIAEAAYHAEVERSVSARLGLTAEAWEHRQVGSVKVGELAALVPDISEFSSAKAHMEEILARSELALGDVSKGEKLTAWRQHRVEKAAISEQVAHELDAALIGGGSRADAVRDMWRGRMSTQSLCFIDCLRVWQTEVPPRVTSADVEAKRQQARGHEEAAQRAADARINAQIRAGDLARRTEQAASLLTTARGWRKMSPKTFDQAELRMQIVLADSARLAAAEKTEKRAQKAWQAALAELEPAEDAAMREEITENPDFEFTPALRRIESECFEVQNAQHSFILADVAAHLVPAMDGDIRTAWLLAGSMMDRWLDEGRVIAKSGNRAAAELLFAGGIRSTDRIHAHISTKNKSVTRETLKFEQGVREDAYNLALCRRKPLKIDVSTLTPEQANFARLVANGAGLVACSGPAGTGKTYLLRSVVKGVQLDGRPVFVVARNTGRAQDVAKELDVSRGLPCAELRNLAGTDRDIPANAVIIVDEAGVIDENHWVDLLERGKGGATIIAVGDREQAQSIDRRATWAVIVEGAGLAGQAAELKTSYRNALWIDEANALRAGTASTVVQTALKEGRLISVLEKVLYATAAQLAQEKSDAGESVTVICVDNEQAAEIARRVQTLRGLVEFIAPISRSQNVAIGDRVRTRENDHGLGIRNGDEWVVRGLRDGKLQLERGGRGEIVEIEMDYARRSLELAYAATADSAQGITITRSVVPLASGQSDRQRLYSAATRGTQPPIYLVATGFEQLTASAAGHLLAAVIERDGRAPTAKEIALAVDEWESENNRAGIENADLPDDEDQILTFPSSRRGLAAGLAAAQPVQPRRGMSM